MVSSPVYFPISLTVPIGVSKGTTVNVLYLPFSMTMERLMVLWWGLKKFYVTFIMIESQVHISIKIVLF